METYLGCKEVKLGILSLLSDLSSWARSWDYVLKFARTYSVADDPSKLVKMPALLEVY